MNVTHRSHERLLYSLQVKIKHFEFEDRFRILKNGENVEDFFVRRLLEEMSNKQEKNSGKKTNI